ncbi:YciI family protein [Pseudomonas yamanorum]|uniref:YCII-related domain-containing protein n=1 Tax=Pseudomonas yamanorum TaxID=515393 RepID=A0A7Y8FF56_9PSED|nr:YciI family protein [Pseudomonas yamanorum]NWE77768.1 hypothetical protein [Pseudomonas yamanorum]
MPLSDEVLQLLKGMLNLPLYVALRHPADLSKFQDHLDAHLNWAIAYERNGNLFASGPFVKAGSAAGAEGGLSIVRATDIEHAQSILREDPFVSNGVYSVTIQKWNLMEGSVNIQLTLSNQQVIFK